MLSKDTRRLQRFQNYGRAFKLLHSALEDKDISEYSANALSHMYDFERFTSIIDKINSHYLQELEKESWAVIKSAI